jgi:predicted TIM-barrel fold metal-dependent hydrolase
MQLVDAHIHLWEKGKPRAAHRQLPYFKEQALADMDAADVDAAVIQPPAWDPDSNAIAIEAARSHPGRFAILGNFPLTEPGAKDRIEGWKDQPGMLGLRYIFNEPQEKAWLEGHEMDWLWSSAERQNIPIAIASGHFIGSLATIAQRYPDLRLIIDHLGVPLGAQGEAAFRQIPTLEALARHPNIAVKATGAPSYATDAYPYRSIHSNLHRIFDAFGPKRYFWGTDITKMPCSWRQCVTMFTEELPWLSSADKTLVMGQALCDWIGWKRQS